MSITLGFDLKRKGASPPVSVRNSTFDTGRLAPFRLKAVTASKITTLSLVPRDESAPAILHAAAG